MTAEKTERRLLRDHGLSLVTGLCFLLFLVGQSIAGYYTYNDDQRDHGEQTVTYPDYITTAHFGEATFENWESEFLQMGAYVMLTVWLRQRGSSESKILEGKEPVDEDPNDHRDDPDAPWPVRRGGLALAIYRHSLGIAFFVLFLASLAAHALTGAHAFSAEQATHGGESVATVDYLRTPQFWFESLQNWQSEFLAVVSIVVLSVFLRQQGSPESKPVHVPHGKTGAE